MKEKKKNKEENKNQKEEYKEKIFNTDEIDSILNGTNNEGMEVLFNVNKNNIKKDEEIFDKELNNLIEKINIFEKSKYHKKNNDNNLNNNKNFNNYIKLNNNNNESNKDNTLNKKISVPINLNYSKNKRLRNTSSLMNIINTTNITYYNNIQSFLSKFFEISTQQKNANNNKNNNSKVKYYPKKDKKIIEKMEQNLFKMRKMSIGFQKNLSQNISTSNQTQKDIKDISLSKKNSSIYHKKSSSLTSSARNQKSFIKRNIYSSISSTYKFSNNSLINTIIKQKNIDSRSKKEKNSMTSRNPPLNKMGLNLYKTKIKNFKGNTYYISDITSRNKNSNNININKKEKLNICSSCSKIRDMKNSNSKTKIRINNNNNSNKNKYSEQYTKKIGYKEINYIRNGTKNNLRERFLYNCMNINNSRNSSRNRNMIKNVNISQPKTNIKNFSKNDSSLGLGLLDILNKRKYQAKNTNFHNFSKIMNFSNKNSHKYNFGLLK
jgi:hypothetical protein